MGIQCIIISSALENIGKLPITSCLQGTPVAVKKYVELLAAPIGRIFIVVVIFMMNTLLSDNFRNNIIVIVFMIQEPCAFFLTKCVEKQRKYVASKNMNIFHCCISLQSDLLTLDRHIDLFMEL